MRKMFFRWTAAAALAAMMSGAGCSRPSLLRNPDPSLDRTRAEFRADATKREYEAAAPKVHEPKVRARVGYALKRLDVVNFTGQNWSNVELWVNRQYVCYVPEMQTGQLKRIHFQMLYDESGQQFPTDNSQVIVRQVEVYRDGKMHEIVCQNDDF